MELGGATIRFGPFDVLSRIGIGGMGEVFRARVRNRPGAPDVALKLLRPEHAGDDHFRAMFLAESRINTLIDHPHIARLIDFGEVDQVLFLATEFVAGVGLDALLAARQLSTPVAVHVALAVLDALAYTHDLLGEDGRPLGLVHRDVSPSNILVSRDGEVKLTDFGIHKIAGQELTLANEVKGKLAFMAPEQLPNRGAVDQRADVFAMGVVLHHMILRRAPFADVAVWIREGAPLAVDGLFGEVIAQALAVEPAGRIGSAREMAATLRKLVTNLDGAGAELGRYVADLTRSERPLGNIDKLIMSQLMDPDTSGLVYAPDPTTDRLFIPRAPTAPHPPSDAIQLAESDFAESEPTSPLSTNAPLEGHTIVDERTDRMGMAVDSTPSVIASLQLPTGFASDPVPSPILIPRPRTSPRTVAFGVLIALALAVPAALGVRLMLRDPPEQLVVAAAAESRPVTRVIPTAAVAPAPEPAEDEPDHTTRRKPKPAPPPAERPVGYLTLDTEPWSTVYLAGRKLGTTPFMRVPLPAGHHQITLDLQDSGQRVQRTVDIPTGGVKRLALRLP